MNPSLRALQARDLTTRPDQGKAKIGKLGSKKIGFALQIFRLIPKVDAVDWMAPHSGEFITFSFKSETRARQPDDIINCKKETGRRISAT